MILGFRVCNYRSFRDEASLSLAATRLDQGVGHDVVVAEDGSTRDVLPVLAVLGANASGKSNILRALAFMRSLVLRSAQSSPFDRIPRDPFRFDASPERSSLFELDFVVDGERFMYGFELGADRIIGEWLFTYPHKRPQTVFERDGDDFQFGRRLVGGSARAVAEIVRPNTLFLSVMATAKSRELAGIYRFFQRGISVLEADDRSDLDQPGIQRLKRLRVQVLRLAAMADLGIREAKIEKVERDPDELDAMRTAIAKSLPSELSPAERAAQVQEILDSFMDRGEVLELIHRSGVGGSSLPFEEESLGTRSWLTFLVYALDALDVGGTLVVDELDLSLHPLLVKEAIGLFQSKRTNTRHAQLIFSTHDATLLGRTQDGLDLSRGQIWFAEKDDHGRSSLTPLSDYRPRKGEDLQKGYLQGRYGGTPRVARGSVSGALTVGRERDE